MNDRFPSTKTIGLNEGSAGEMRVVTVWAAVR